LLGLGVTELSAAPSVVPQIKYLIRRLKMADAENLAEFALQCESAGEILARCRKLVQQVAPTLVENL
jgi:phosphoenolpyruvate-protein kinase (PTS system EI component)